MWTSLHLKNFMALDDVEVSLGPFTVLVGKSGSGKSSVLRGAELLGQVYSSSCRERGRKSAYLSVESVFGGAYSARRLARQQSTGAPTRPLEVQARAGDTWRLVRLWPGRHNMELPPGEKLRFLPMALVEWSNDAGDPTALRHLRLPLDGPADPRPAADDAAARDAQQETLQAFLTLPDDELTRSALYRFELSHLAAAGPLQDDHATLLPEGSNLVAHLRDLASERPETFRELAERLREVIPGVRGVRVKSDEKLVQRVQTILVEGTSAREVEREASVPAGRVYVEMAGEGLIPSDLLSEGVLMTLAVLTAALTNDQPRTLLIDDLDRGLHPSAHAALVEVLHRVQDQARQRGAALQIICTSHSPYTLDACAAEEVRVLARDAQGRVGCRALSEHPRWAEWRSLMKPGEFWSGVAEEWVLEAMS